METEGITQGSTPVDSGQVDIASKVTSNTSPEATDRQPEGGKTVVATDSAGPQQQADDTFFDPESIKDKPELMAAYKQMQKAYTKKTMSIKDVQRKAEAYDQFNSNPKQYMEQLARQMGYSLTPAGQRSEPEDWQPQTWDDVLAKAEEQAEARVMKKLEPYLGQIQNMRKKNIETFLDDNAPDWRQYEDDMMSTLKKHPSLVDDPLSLYRLSVPQDVLMSRATQQVLKKMESKAKSAGTSGISTTAKGKSTEMPDRPLSFNEAVEFAKRQMAAGAK